jgi:hypothetical protein
MASCSSPNDAIRIETAFIRHIKIFSWRSTDRGVLWEVPWYLNPVFLPAASGLLGVIVGGLITAGSSYVLDKRRERREERLDTQRARHQLLDSTAAAIEVLLQNIETARNEIDAFRPRIFRT